MSDRSDFFRSYANKNGVDISSLSDADISILEAQFEHESKEFIGLGFLSPDNKLCFFL